MLLPLCLISIKGTLQKLHKLKAVALGNITQAIVKFRAYASCERQSAVGSPQGAGIATPKDGFRLSLERGGEGRRLWSTEIRASLLH
jgi:hypothetical protein